ncbi:MAG: holo-ACP synthase [Oscillospiraceae bacterium]|nr:holo-ACP synthase [Oscillospiraceae bacterium]
MIRGIGIDLCMISRIQRILDREGETGSFFRLAFTDAENAEARERHNKAAFYAARFAVKEAVFKAVAPSLAESFDFRLVESLHRPDGSPYVSITEALQPYLDAAGIQMLHLSVTTEGDFAQAIVIAES